MTTAFLQGIGPLELGLVLLIVLLIFGGRRLPQLGRQLGGGLREFKDSVTSRTAAQYEDEDKTGRTQASAALGRPAGEETPADRRVVNEP